MSSSDKRAESTGVRDSGFPFAAAGGVRTRVEIENSFADWLELMELVEALCPEWPARAPMRDGGFRI